ncbi:MAG TPA: hypothetical protein VK400_16680 [Pyrinomonadaceae bacterium]|nr:hypothetical protein [Pyrinomonadaceae bacterium]
MNRRFFWQIPEYIKFRIVFEDEETILGATDDNEYRLFRKDTNQIVFSICKAIDLCFASMAATADESESFGSSKSNNNGKKRAASKLPAALVA